MYPDLMKENRRMSTCNRLHLQTLGSQLVTLKNLPDHCSRHRHGHFNIGHGLTLNLGSYPLLIKISNIKVACSSSSTWTFLWVQKTIHAHTFSPQNACPRQPNVGNWNERNGHYYKSRVHVPLY